ncbi:MAG: B12-binding domain-containing radical SAM protein [Nitrospirae bacterium]|nr:B12-binding domain-containing radical SAM protein [Nitrospirota bacterium]
MRKKVLLVKPPEKSNFNFGTFSLGVLGAAIRDRADVAIFDATNLSIDEAIQTIYFHKPNILGITVMGLTSVEPTGLLIQRIKKDKGKFSQALKDTLIIAGGHGASMAYTHLLKAGVHAVVIGEGELTLQRILSDGIHPGTPGIACLNGKKIVVGSKQQLIRPLDSLHPPARDLMPFPSNGVHLMETSRGCPHNCGFCETTRFYGQVWRPYSPDRVVAEVKRLVNEYNAWIIHFADDNFAASPHRVIEICKKLKRIALPAFIMASARADDLISYPELIPMMASARILRISVGVETLEPEMSKIINKPISIESYKKAFSLMRDYGIFSIASFIIGIPGEKIEMRQRALDLAIEIGVDSAHFLPFLPLPGIPLLSKKGKYDAAPADIRDAYLLTKKFRQHRTVRNRLQVASEQGSIRGLLARATLSRQAIVCQ